MRIFDALTRTDGSPKSRSERSFEFLNRSARPEFDEIRCRIEDWLCRSPNGPSRELVERLRSKRDSDHSAALFELFAHELLVRLGWRVQVAPTLPTTMRTPDFLATMGSERMLVEATEVRPKTSPNATHPLEDAIFDAINELDSPNFFLSVRTGGELLSAPPHSVVVAPWKEFMAAYDPEAVAHLIELQGPDAAPAQRVEWSGWWMEANLMPKFKSRGDGSTRTIGMGPWRSGWTNGSKPLRNALHEKASKYSGTGLPLIVMVNAPDVDRIDETEALFGREQVTFTGGPGDAPSRMTRAADGVWMGPGHRPRHQSLSGALIFRGVAPWSLRSAPTCLYLNPFAHHSVPTEALVLPHASVVGEQIVWSPGIDVGQVLGVA